VSFSDEERAESIAALSKTADMVELVRSILLIFAQESGRGVTDAELKPIHDHQTIWRRLTARSSPRVSAATEGGLAWSRRKQPIALSTHEDNLTPH
jgi:hypothetical protein